MFQQLTLIRAVCDYCRAQAQVRRGGDVTDVFASEEDARRRLGLDGVDPARWRELDSGLLVCPQCARARDCVLGGGHYFDEWATCGCGGHRGNHIRTARGDVCAYEIRACPQCHTLEHRHGADVATSESNPHAHTSGAGR